jgi:GIY-YIG catalytic domain-containing protein
MVTGHTFPVKGAGVTLILPALGATLAPFPPRGASTAERAGSRECRGRHCQNIRRTSPCRKANSAPRNARKRGTFPPVFVIARSAATRQFRAMQRDFRPAVYIMANRRNGAVYTGVTSNLVQRVWQHREAVIDASPSATVASFSPGTSFIQPWHTPLRGRSRSRAARGRRSCV